MAPKPVKQRLICKRLARIGYDRADVDAPFGIRRRDVWLAEVQIMGIFLTPPPCIAVTGFLITCMIFSFLDFKYFIVDVGFVSRYSDILETGSMSASFPPIWLN